MAFIAIYAVKVQIRTYYKVVKNTFTIKQASEFFANLGYSKCLMKRYNPIEKLSFIIDDKKQLRKVENSWSV